MNNKNVFAILSGANAVLCITAAVIRNALAFIPCALSLVVTALMILYWYDMQKKLEKFKNQKEEKINSERKLKEREEAFKREYSKLQEENRRLILEKNELLKQPVSVAQAAQSAQSAQTPNSDFEQKNSNEQLITAKYNEAAGKSGNALYRFVNSGTKIGKIGDKWAAASNGWLTSFEDNGVVYAYPVVDVSSGENLKMFGVLDAFSTDRNVNDDRETIHIGQIHKAAVFVCSGDEYILKEKGKMSLR